MSARFALAIALWASLVIGVVQLFAHAAVPTGAAIGVGAGVLGVQAFGVARSRRLRSRTWRRPGDEPEMASGPRRVLLVETGLTFPK